MKTTNILVEEIEALLLRFGGAYGTAFNEIDPHNRDKHSSSFEAMRLVSKRSKEIEQEATTKIAELVNKQVVAGRIDELENVQLTHGHYVTETFAGGKQQTIEKRIAQLKEGNK